MELHICHCTSLIRLNVSWFVTEQQVGEPLLVRPLLETLGLNMRTILAAAPNRYTGAVYESDTFAAQDDHSEGSICSVLDGVFHADSGDAQSDDEYDSDWCDLGPESDAEWNGELQSCLSEAEKAGVSTNGLSKLEAMLRKYLKYIRVRLNVGTPANVERLVLRLQQVVVQVHANPRRYAISSRNMLSSSTTWVL